MAATQGHTQSLHTNALDEAIALPTDFSARIARNTQLVLQQESGTTRVIDPWGGSAYVERLTHDLAKRAWAHIEEVEAPAAWPRPSRPASRRCASRRPPPAPRRASTPAAAGHRRQPYPVDEDEPDRRAQGRQRRRARQQIAKLERCAPSATSRGRGGAGALTGCRRSFGGLDATCSRWPSTRRAPRRRSARSPGAGGGLRPLHRADPYDLRRVQRRGGQDESVAPRRRWSRSSRRPRAAARASSSPRWARTATTAARRSSRPPSPTSASTSTWARCSRRPAEVARQAVEADVHVVGVSSLAAGHLTLVPALRRELDALGREDLMIVVGGVIPAQDFDELRAAGADAIYPPGTVIARRRSTSSGVLPCRPPRGRRRAPRRAHAGHRVRRFGSASPACPGPGSRPSSTPWDAGCSSVGTGSPSSRSTRPRAAHRRLDPR
jgi:methylmalonyl-CoA mutase